MKTCRLTLYASSCTSKKGAYIYILNSTGKHDLIHCPKTHVAMKSCRPTNDVGFRNSKEVSYTYIINSTQRHDIVHCPITNKLKDKRNTVGSSLNYEFTY